MLPVFNNKALNFKISQSNFFSKKDVFNVEVTDISAYKKRNSSGVTSSPSKTLKLASKAMNSPAKHKRKQAELNQLEVRETDLPPVVSNV